MASPGIGEYLSPTAAVQVSLSDDYSAELDQGDESWQYWGPHPGTDDAHSPVFVLSDPSSQLCAGFAFFGQEHALATENHTRGLCDPMYRYLRAGCQLSGHDNDTRFDVDYQLVKESPTSMFYRVTVTNRSSITEEEARVSSVDVLSQLWLSSCDNNSSSGTKINDGSNIDCWCGLVKTGNAEVRATWPDAESAMDDGSTYYWYYEDDADEILLADSEANRSTDCFDRPLTNRDPVGSRAVVRHHVELPAGASRTLCYRLSQARCLISPDFSDNSCSQLLSTAEATAVSALLGAPMHPGLLPPSIRDGARGAIINGLSCLMWDRRRRRRRLSYTADNDDWAAAFQLIPLARLDKRLVKRELLDSLERIRLSRRELDASSQWCRLCAAVMPAVLMALIEIERLHGSLEQDFLIGALAALEPSLHRWFSLPDPPGRNVIPEGDALGPSRSDELGGTIDCSVWRWFCVAKALELSASLGQSQSVELLTNMLLESETQSTHVSPGRSSTSAAAVAGTTEDGEVISQQLAPLLECALVRLTLTELADCNNAESNSPRGRLAAIIRKSRPSVGPSFVGTDPSSLMLLVSRQLLDGAQFRQACQSLFDAEKLLARYGVRSQEPSLQGCSVSLPINYLVLDVLTSWERLHGGSESFEFPANSGGVAVPLRMIIADLCRRVLSLFDDWEPSQAPAYESYDADTGVGLGKPDAIIAALAFNVAVNAHRMELTEKPAVQISDQPTVEQDSGTQLKTFKDLPVELHQRRSPPATEKHSVTEIVWQHTILQVTPAITRLGCSTSQNNIDEGTSDSDWLQQECGSTLFVTNISNEECNLEAKARIAKLD